MSRGVCLRTNATLGRISRGAVAAAATCLRLRPRTLGLKATARFESSPGLLPANESNLGCLAQRFPEYGRFLLKTHFFDVHIDLKLRCHKLLVGWSFWCPFRANQTIPPKEEAEEDTPLVSSSGGSGLEAGSSNLL